MPIPKAVKGFVYVSKICQKESSIETMSNKAFIKFVPIKYEIYPILDEKIVFDVFTRGFASRENIKDNFFISIW